MNILKIFQSKKSKIVMTSIVAIMLALSITLSGLQFQVTPDKKVRLTIGSVYAAADYSFTGTADDVPFQAALNALPSTGGEIHVMSPAAGFTTINFTATVTRAIDNVTITGIGQGSSFAYNAGTALFTMGGNNWVFKDIKTDAGGINTNSKTGWIYQNVLTGSTFYAYKTATDVTGDEWYIPTGRSASYKIAATDATASEKAQADVLVVGTADDEIQTGLTAGKSVELSSGTFSIHTAMTMSTSNTWLKGQGNSTIIKLEDAHNAAIVVLTVSGNYCTVSDIQWHGNDAAQGSGNDDAIIVSGTNCTVQRNYVHDWNHYAIRFSGTANFGLAANNNVSASYTGIQIFGDYSKIVDNNIDDISALDGGASVYQCAEYMVSNNMISNAYYGVTVNQADGSRRGIISNNTILTTDDAGIWIDTVYENNVIGNTITGSGNIGIRCENTTGSVINSNIIKAAGRHGIYIYGSDPVGSDCVYSSNYITEASGETDNTYSGIEVESAAYVEICDNVIRQGGAANDTKYGIEVGAGSTKAYIHGNDLYSSGQSGDLSDGGTSIKRDNRNNAGTGLLADS